MAVDTRDKRFSLVSFAQPHKWFAPNPDGSFATTADRAQLTYLYAGITLDGGTPPDTSAADWMLMAHRRRR